MTADVTDMRGWWEKEIEEAGWPQALKDRLDFHNTLVLEDVIVLSGRTKTTVRRHMGKLVEKGYAEWWFVGGELKGITRIK